MRPGLYAAPVVQAHAALSPAAGLQMILTASLHRASNLLNAAADYLPILIGEKQGAKRNCLHEIVKLFFRG
ncbi:hypothetical protein DXA13_15790 [Clostridium sp. AM58-1XD]|nr:hypothetical protein DXA13_15790 [Clostridium sp. AM58-1XD]